MRKEWVVSVQMIFSVCSSVILSRQCSCTRCSDSCLWNTLHGPLVLICPWASARLDEVCCSRLSQLVKSVSSNTRNCFCLSECLVVCNLQSNWSKTKSVHWKRERERESDNYPNDTQRHDTTNYCLCLPFWPKVQCVSFRSHLSRPELCRSVVAINYFSVTILSVQSWV